MPTKKEIYDIEQENTGVIHLYAEGMFYCAYEKSAYLLCSLIHPFKVSGHFVKTIGDNFLSVGFPQTSLEKWSCGHPVRMAGGYIVEIQ